MKKRVHEIAKQQGLTSKEVLAALKAAGIEAKVAASSVEEADALKALAAAGDGATAAKPTPKASAPQAKSGDAKPPPKEAAGAARPVRRPPSGRGLGEVLGSQAPSGGHRLPGVAARAHARAAAAASAAPPRRPPPQAAAGGAAREGARHRAGAGSDQDRLGGDRSRGRGDHGRRKRRGDQEPHGDGGDGDADPDAARRDGGRSGQGARIRRSRS